MSTAIDVVRKISMYLTNEIKLLPCHRDNAYKHGGITLRGSRRRNFDQRQKMLISNPRLRTTTLIEADVQSNRTYKIPFIKILRHYPSCAPPS